MDVMRAESNLSALDRYIETLHTTLSLDPRGLPFRHARSNSEGLLTIEREIRELRRAISLLSTRQNDLVACGQLPPEILSEIFLWVRSLHAPGMRGMSYGWTAVTSVCRRWRQAALGCARLWDRLDFSCPMWVETLMERSTDIAVDLHVVDPAAADGSTLAYIRRRKDYASFADLLRRVLVDHGRRIRSVVIHGELDEQGPIFPDLYLLAPNMTECSLRCTSVIFDTSIEEIPPAYPSLSTLKLSNVVIEPPLPIFSSLTYLYLNDSELGSAADIVHMVRSTPTLETVILLQTLFRHDDVPPPPTQKAHETAYLPRLRLLRVDDDLQACWKLLHLLSIPAECSLVIECGIAERQFDWSEDVLLSLVAFLRDHITNAARIGRTTDTVDVNISEHVWLRAWSGSDYADLVGEISCSLALVGISPSAQAEILRRLPVADVTRLDFAVAGAVTRWDNLFRMAPNLVHLELPNTSLEAIPALAAEPSKDTERRCKPRRAILPHLTTLAVEFRDRDKKPLCRSLRDMIQVRNRSKTSERIETLYIYGAQSHTMREIVKELYAIVPKVWWSEVGWIGSEPIWNGCL
jgi:hypothetical protein